MDRYENLGTVGEGSYGVVIKCKDKTSGVFVAIKKFLETDADKAVKKIATREIKILKMLRHENLVNLIEVFRKNKRVYLVFEFIEHNLLEEIEKTINGLGENRTREIMYQVCKGLDFMHSNNFIHRDLKPENILINKAGLVKLCDFGFARQIAQPTETYTDYVATRWYRSPELLVGDPKYGKPVDVWSVGVLAYEVLTSKPLFPGESDLDQLFLIINSLGDLPETMKVCFQQNQFYANAKFPRIKNFNPLQNKLKKYSSNLTKFIMEALIIDPNKRATSSDLLQHDFFTQNAWIEEFSIKLKGIVALYEAALSTSIGHTSSLDKPNNVTNISNNANNTIKQTNNVNNNNNSNINNHSEKTNGVNLTKPVVKANQSNHVLKVNVKNHSNFNKPVDPSLNNTNTTQTNQTTNIKVQLNNSKEYVNNTNNINSIINNASKNHSEMYIIKQKNFDLNVNEPSKHANTTNINMTNNVSNSIINSNSKKLPKIELIQSQSPKMETQQTNSLKNISINFNGNNALKTSESSFKLTKSKNDQSLEFSFSNSINKSIINSINNPTSNNNNTNSNSVVNTNTSENFVSNSETNLNSIELNTSIIVTNDNSSDLKQINLASTTNSVYILEETFKLNKKNPFKRDQNANISRRENTNDLNLPHVKQIEMFPKKEKNFIYEKKNYLKEPYLMQVNKK